MPTLADLKQAENEADHYFQQWNLLMERRTNGGGYVSPLERQRALDAWMRAENKAGELRRQINRSQSCEHQS